MTVNGPEVYIGPIKGGVGVANVNYWEGMPSNLSGYKGYTYDIYDLKMRRTILNGSSHVLKVAILTMEAQGIAEPLTGENYWNLYGQTLGNLKLGGMYLNMMLDVNNFIGGTQQRRRGTFNAYTPSNRSSGHVSAGKPTFNEFNQFRNANKGAFTGHGGRGTSTKVAWDAYIQYYGY